MWRASLGDEAFRKELLAQMHGKPGPEHYGEEQSESEEAKAERILDEELRRLRWTKGEVSARPSRWPWRSECGRRRR